MPGPITTNTLFYGDNAPRKAVIAAEGECMIRLCSRVSANQPRQLIR